MAAGIKRDSFWSTGMGGAGAGRATAPTGQSCGFLEDFPAAMQSVGSSYYNPYLPVFDFLNDAYYYLDKSQNKECPLIIVIHNFKSNHYG